MRDFPSESEILRVFDQDPEKTFRLRELVVELGLRSSQARDLKHALKELSRHRKILDLKKGHFALSPSNRAASDRAPSHPTPRPHVAGVSVSAARGHRRGLVSGRLIAHRDGYGFVVPDDPRIGADIFVPRPGMSSALHGDRVEVHVIEKRPMP